ncbi:MAG TPA: RDD family protein, partial [Mycobacterium sp.]|nr:RDD family protein [Mycobacterium sp.]
MASWASRAGGFAIDGLFVPAVVTSLTLVALAASNWPWWLSVAIGVAATFLIVEIGRVIVSAISTWTLGRALFGIAVLRPDGTRPGPWRLLVRDLAHLLDTLAVFVGWLWPLWDSRNRTFADLLLRTEVR